MSSVVSDEPLPVVRYPLGLPAGSVRALLSVMIAGLFWLLLILPPDKPAKVPLYLFFLLGLVLVFFAAHGHTIAPAGTSHPSPWHLPRGTFRWLIILGSVAVVAWQWHVHPAVLEDRLTPDKDQLNQWPTLLLALSGGFTLGWIVRLGPWKNTYWFQDIQAWVALLALLGLGVEIIIRFLINPNIEQAMNFPLWEAIVVAVVSFYFGLRS